MVWGYTFNVEDQEGTPFYIQVTVDVMVKLLAWSRLIVNNILI